MHIMSWCLTFILIQFVCYLNQILLWHTMMEFVFLAIHLICRNQYFATTFSLYLFFSVSLFLYSHNRSISASNRNRFKDERRKRKKGLGWISRDLGFNRKLKWLTHWMKRKSIQTKICRHVQIKPLWCI